jgi:hypothetical protein
VLGATSVLLIDAATYVIAVVLVAALHAVPAARPQAGEHRNLRAGFRFIARDRLLRCGGPPSRSETPRGRRSSSRAGARAHPLRPPPGDRRVLIASFGVGALVGNAVSFRFLARRFEGSPSSPPSRSAGRAAVAALAAAAAAALSALIFASGIANGLVNPSLHAITTLRVPPPLRPNVFATSMVGWALVNPLGLFVTGPVLDAFGTTPVLIGFAAVQTR